MQCDDVPRGVAAPLRVDPEANAPMTAASKHNIQYVQTTRDACAVTRHHTGTKEDAAQILCEWFNNAHTDMIGCFPEGQTHRPGRTQSIEQSIERRLASIKSWRL